MNIKVSGVPERFTKPIPVESFKELGQVISVLSLLIEERYWDFRWNRQRRCHLLIEIIKSKNSHTKSCCISQIPLNSWPAAGGEDYNFITSLKMNLPSLDGSSARRIKILSDPRRGWYVKTGWLLNKANWRPLGLDYAQWFFPPPEARIFSAGIINPARVIDQKNLEFLTNDDLRPLTESR